MKSLAEDDLFDSRALTKVARTEVRDHERDTLRIRSGLRPHGGGVFRAAIHALTLIADATDTSEAGRDLSSRPASM